ncbi:hypothetical protein MASR1M45_09490 [Candidatus Kapaibacterium sp.]
MYKTFTNILFMAFLGALLLNNCSGISSQDIINPKDFKGVSQVRKGDAAKLVWKFENAEKVRIKELQRNYSPTDSINVFSDSSNTLSFVITKGKDTLNLSWKIYVYDVKDDIETGPVTQINDDSQQSFINSDYIRGIQKSATETKLKNLKIMRHYFPYKSLNFIHTRAIVLDEFGNYVRGLALEPHKSNFVNAEIGCGDDFKKTSLSTVKEFIDDNKEGVDFTILVDNSAIAGDFFPIYEQLKLFIKDTDSSDKFSLYSFNQNISEILKLSSYTGTDINISPDKPHGLSAIYKSLNFLLDSLKSNHGKNVIILVAYSTDNNSIVYDRNDVIDKAIAADIPIYVIGIGNAVDTYSLRSISTLSGARYYGLDENQLSDIKLVMNEICFSQKYYYEFDITVPVSPSGACSNIHANVDFSHNNSHIRDSLILPSTRSRQEFNYMALASFEYKDTTLVPEYLESVLLLADVMKKNPQLPVELIGNSSIEGNDRVNYELGLKRAQAVRKILIANGVNPAKIRVRSDGSNNPVYYIQDSYWMQYYNRRVELKWLDPALLPFEIIAQTYDTESEALNMVEKWEDRGYRAYYERYLVNNIPTYRVKIWGYSTLKEAEKIAKKLSSDFEYQFTVQ